MQVGLGEVLTTLRGGNRSAEVGDPARRDLLDAGERSSDEIRTETTTTVTQEDTTGLRLRRLQFLRNVVNASGWEHEGRDIMMSSEFNYGEIAAQAGVGQDEIEAARRPINDLLEQGTDGKAESLLNKMHRGGENTPGLFNVIPSQGNGPCRPILVVACFDKDSFANRLQEAIEHVSIICKETRLVLFVTSRWMRGKWQAKEHLIPMLTAQFVVLLAGPDRTPVRLR